MAGERKGKIYEALIKVVLDRLLAKGFLNGTIFWNVKPDVLTVEPDFTVGRAADDPTIVLLITHGGASKKSTMKMWRNVGELAETKTLFPRTPRVYSVVFDAVAYDALKQIQDFIFDGQLIVGDRSYGRLVQAWVDANNASLPKEDVARANEIRARLASRSDRPLSAFFPLVQKDIESLILKRRPELDTLWKLERARKPGIAPRARSTSVRRGLSKLMIFEEPDLVLRLYRGRTVPLSEVPAYAFVLNLAGKAVGHATATDAEIMGAVQLLSDKDIKLILNDFVVHKIISWLVTLRNAPHLQFMSDYIISEYRRLCDARTLAKRLKQLYSDPWALVDRTAVPPNWPPEFVWLLEYLIEVIKVSTGNISGFGHAQLGRMVFDTGGCTASDLTSAIGFGGGFGLSAWIARKPECKFADRLVDGIARVLSSLLQKTSIDVIKKNTKTVNEQYVRSLIEAKLCTYVGFDPLWSLLKKKLPDCREINVRAGFAEAACVAGAAARMQVAVSKKTLINWQSATDAGKDHKVKELCGRAVGLRYSWDAIGRRFVPRPSVKKLILLIDGTWRRGDLLALARAGWDEIFYPDEMDKLARAIV